MRPVPGEVLHFSEDPTITRFVPHVAATSAHARPYVWAVGHDRAPDYWFPRQCPRALVWATGDTVVATEPVTPLGPPEAVGDLIDCHAVAGIQLRLVNNLWPYWDLVVGSTAGFSGIRLHNAKPR